MYGYNIVGRKTFFDNFKVDPIYLNRDISIKNINLPDSVHIVKEQWLNHKANQIDLLINGLYKLITDFNELKSKK